jgi:hypothetical protein
LDIDAVAGQLTAHADVAGWARSIGADLLPPPSAPAERPAPAPVGGSDLEPGAALAMAAPMPPTDVLRRVPTKQPAYDRWRQLWAELAADPDIDPRQFADRHGISVRQVQWIRSVGATGLLNSPIPPAVRLAQLASTNGHLPHDPEPAS